MSPFFLTATTSFLALCLGVYLLAKNSVERVKKNLSHEVSSFVIEGIKSYGIRSFWSIFQLLLYTSIALLIVTTITKSHFHWDQIGAFFLGGLSMSVSLFVLSGIIPMFIPKLIEKFKGYLNEGIQFQFNCTSAIGFISITTVLLFGPCLLYIINPTLLIGYSLGTIYASFFTRIGGGLFKSCTHIGFHLCSSRYPLLPKREKQNPGHITNISAEYIHKLCGFCSDITGSLIICVVSLILLTNKLTIGSSLSASTNVFINMLPFKIMSISMVSCAISFFVTSLRIKQKALQNFLLESLYIALFICAAGTYYIMHATPSLPPSIWTGMYNFHPFIAYMSGLLGAVAVCYSSEYLTSSTYSKAKKCAQESEYGTAMIQLFSLSLGFKSASYYILTLLIISSIAYYSAGLLGIGIATLAMLSLSPTIISIHSFSPLAKSVLNSAHLSTTSQTVLNHAKKTDSLGQSTFAIGSSFTTLTSILATCSLCFTYLFVGNISFSVLFSLNLYWIVGIILGLLSPLFCSGFLLHHVLINSKKLCADIKSQFEQIRYLNEGKASPDIHAFADKLVQRCMDGLIVPGISIGLPPIIMGYFFSEELAFSLALGTLIACIMLSFFSSISGEIVANAKRYIEGGKLGGTSTSSYHAIVESNLLSSVLRDVLAPSLSIFIKCSVLLAAMILIFLN